MLSAAYCKLIPLIMEYKQTIINVLIWLPKCYSERGKAEPKDYWEGKADLPIPLRWRIHQDVLKLLVFREDAFFPIKSNHLLPKPYSPPMNFRILENRKPLNPVHFTLFLNS